MTAAAKFLEEESDLVECDLECLCRARHTMLLPGDAPVRETLASLTCPTCERTGALTLAPAISYPPTKDPDDCEGGC